jgi:hypothetical protein
MRCDRRQARRAGRAAAACRSLTDQHGKVHFTFLQRRVCLARNFNTHAAPCLHGGNYFLLLPRSSCADLDFNLSAAQSLRQPTSPAGTVQTLRGGQMLEFCRADPILKFVF